MSLNINKATGYALTIGGYFLGHSHKGRQFLPSIHGKFATILYIPIALQLFLGIYLKLHIHEQTIRPWAVKAHGVLGKAYPIFGWVQMLFGAITFRSYCRDGNLGQCLAHYIMVGTIWTTESMVTHNHEGKWIHRLWYHHGYYVCCRRSLGKAQWS